MIKFANNSLKQIQRAKSSISYLSRATAAKSGEKLNENGDFHAYFIQSERHRFFPKPCDFVFALPQRNSTTSWNEISTSSSNLDFILAFEDLLIYCNKSERSLSDGCFDEFVDKFIARLETFTLEEVIQSLQIFVSNASLTITTIREKNFIELFMAFDYNSVIKLNNMSVKELLYLSSIWLCVPFAKKSFFSLSVCRLFNRFVKTMSAEELSHALFYINCMNRPIDDIRSFENVFDEKIETMTPEEMAMVLWSFDRLNTKVEKKELQDKIFDYIENQELATLSDAFLRRILVSITSISVTSDSKAPQLVKLLQNLQPTMHKRSLKTCILIVHTGVPLRVCNDEQFEVLMQRCVAESLEDLSMHDLELLSRIVSMFESVDGLEKKIGKLVLDELLARIDNVGYKTFYKQLIYIVRNLTLIDIYNLELMHNLFRPEYITFMNKSMKQIEKEMYEIDGYNRINLKDSYNGNVLSDNYLDKLKFLVEFIPDKVNNYKKKEDFVYSIEQEVESIFKHYNYAHAVAHCRNADIFVCIDKRTQQAIDVAQNFPPLYTGISFSADTLTLKDPNLVVLAFVAGHSKSFVDSKTNPTKKSAIGILKQKCQQLAALGYHVILVPWEEWHAIKSQNERENYLRLKSSDILQNILIDSKEKKIE